MENEPKLLTTEETERLIELKAAKPGTGEDLTKLADFFDDHPDDDAEPDKAEEHQPEAEQSLSFLIGGERYLKD